MPATRCRTSRPCAPGRAATLSLAGLGDRVTSSRRPYAILAGLERVDHIVNGRTYMFGVAKSVVPPLELRRSRIVALDAPAEAEGLEIRPAASPRPRRWRPTARSWGASAALIATLPAKSSRSLHPAQGARPGRSVRWPDAWGVSERTSRSTSERASGVLVDRIGAWRKRALPGI
ncbi:RNA polymerase sigma factor [Caulobacter segnis]